MDSSLEVKLTPRDAPLSADCGILIPAFNEEKGVAEIVKTALASKLGPVLVVDDGSQDSTAQVAQDAGAVVLKLPINQGKGGAVYAGASTLETRVIVLLDADLLGLTPQHLHDLAEPVINNKLDMTRGVFTGGRLTTTTAQKLAPYLNGQRALLRKKLLALPDFKDARFGIEVIISQGAQEQNWTWQDVSLKDVSQVMKEEKRGFWKGFEYRMKMYFNLFRTYFKVKQKVNEEKRRKEN